MVIWTIISIMKQSGITEAALLSVSLIFSFGDWSEEIWQCIFVREGRWLDVEVFITHFDVNLKHLN